MNLADQNKDEKFLEIPHKICKEIEAYGGTTAIDSWCPSAELEIEDSDGNYIKSIDTVTYSINNTTWSHKKMLSDLLRLTSKKKYKGILFRVILFDSEAKCFSTSICLHDGKLTCVLFDEAKGRFTEVI